MASPTSEMSAGITFTDLRHNSPSTLTVRPDDAEESPRLKIWERKSQFWRIKETVFRVELFNAALAALMGLPGSKLRVD
jgi:hypothetical protein